MQIRRNTVPAVVALACLAGSAAAQSIARMGDLPGGQTYSNAASMSYNGLVVVGVSNDTAEKPVRWASDTGLNPIGSLPGTAHAQALAVSGDGRVIFGGVTYANNTTGAFRWSATDGMSALPAWPGHHVSYAYGTNMQGADAVGYAVNASSGCKEAYRWSIGGYESMGTLPGFTDSVAFGLSGNNISVVGYCDGSHSGLPRAFRWKFSAGMQDLPTPAGTNGSMALGTSYHGDYIVGYLWNGPTQPTRACRWLNNASVIELGSHGPGLGSVATACSGDGSVVVGYAYVAPGTVDDRRAFIWDAQHGMRDLSDVLTAASVNMNGWVLRSANSICNDASVVCGEGIDPQGQPQGFIARLRPVCKGDLNGDGLINTQDLTIFLGRFGTVAIPFLDGDLDGSGTVNTLDLTQFLAAFGGAC
jgi:uncharacterized membrane protein